MPANIGDHEILECFRKVNWTTFIARLITCQDFKKCNPKEKSENLRRKTGTMSGERRLGKDRKSFIKRNIERSNMQQISLYFEQRHRSTQIWCGITQLVRDTTKFWKTVKCIFLITAKSSGSSQVFY